jgi:hypothetical protein
MSDLERVPATSPLLPSSTLMLRELRPGAAEVPAATCSAVILRVKVHETLRLVPSPRVYGRVTLLAQATVSAVLSTVTLAKVAVSPDPTVSATV